METLLLLLALQHILLLAVALHFREQLVMAVLVEAVAAILQVQMAVMAAVMAAAVITVIQLLPLPVMAKLPLPDLLAAQVSHFMLLAAAVEQE